MKAGILLVISITTTSGNPHQPYNWTFSRWKGPALLKSNITAGAPSFLISLCELVPIEPCLNQKGYYLCPNSNSGKSTANGDEAVRIGDENYTK